MRNDERMKRRQATRDAILDVEREASEFEEDLITGQHDLEELKRRQPSVPDINITLAAPSKPASDPPSTHGGPGFSLRTAGGTKIRASGGQAIAAVAVVAAIALLIAWAAGWNPFPR